jgi:hypothetical protein
MLVHSFALGNEFVIHNSMNGGNTTTTTTTTTTYSAFTSDTSPTEKTVALFLGHTQVGTDSKIQ